MSATSVIDITRWLESGLVLTDFLRASRFFRVFLKISLA